MRRLQGSLTCDRIRTVSQCLHTPIRTCIHMQPRPPAHTRTHALSPSHTHYMYNRATTVPNIYHFLQCIILLSHAHLYEDYMEDKTVALDPCPLHTITHWSSTSGPCLMWHYDENNTLPTVPYICKYNIVYPSILFVELLDVRGFLCLSDGRLIEYA